jgi:signal transduction histidine kinase
MQLSEHLWVAEADPNQLESALLNLVINARDAMPDGGKLVVGPQPATGRPLHRGLQQPQTGRLRGAQRHDNGCGMPQSVISRAFDPFFTTKPIGQGTGLGCR